MTDMDHQFRIDRVQVLNWGAFGGLQVMHAGRFSTALLGPSGRGKSTLLDAMASVIMPNPQEFNQAARDDKGHKRERTVYTYARGLTVNHQDDDGARSSTPQYLRRGEDGGFPSGVALTWSTGTGKRVTAVRVAWVSSQATDNEAIANNTVYGFIHDYFDLERLNGLTPTRAGASPISPATMGRLIDPGRGDVLSTKQQTVHASMRSAMQMGSTHESQRLALQLLRRAQASKGVFSINDLFKEFVLTQPDAMRRWDVTLALYTEATRLFAAFELARLKASTLKDLPETEQQHREAGAEATIRRLVLREEEEVPARLRIWHAGKVAEWAARALDDIAVDLAEAQENWHTAQARIRERTLARNQALEALAGAPEDRGGVLRERLSQAEREREVTNERRAVMAHRLEEFDAALPTSAGDLTLTRTLLQQEFDKLADQVVPLRDAYEAAVGRQRQIAEQITEKKADVKDAIDRGGNIPPAADGIRRRIAEASGVPAGQLMYVGELLDIPPGSRKWEHAIVRIIRPLASDLVVPIEHLPAVRDYVNRTDLRADITLAPAGRNMPESQHPTGTIASMVQLTAGPYRGWLSQQLTRFTYLAVESDADLDGDLPKGVVGRVTRAGMRTAHHGRFVKSDTPMRHRWIGQDNSDLLSQLKEEVEGLHREYDAAQAAVTPARLAYEEHQRRMDDLKRLISDLLWPDLDISTIQARITQITDELQRADTPEQRARREEFDRADAQLEDAKDAGRHARTALEDIDLRRGIATFAQDGAKDILEAHPGLNNDEAAALAPLPFTAPVVSMTGLNTANADDRTKKALAESYGTAKELVRAQANRDEERRANLEKTLLLFLRSYRGINERTHSEVDETIDSIPALLAIYEQLITDDLPRARQNWITKVNADLNQALRTVDRQIEIDRHGITAGLDPINEVLAGVPFRDGSQLKITAEDRPSPELQRFRKVVRRFTQNNPLGVDLLNDADQVEGAFRRLQGELSKLTEASRAGNTWRRNVFDAREHVTFQAIETPPHGARIVHDGVSGMSGGEGQELIAFILGAALRYRLGDGTGTPPTYGTVILDEGFVKADSDYTGRSLRALQALGFQLIVGAPREKATAFEDYVDQVAYITRANESADIARIHQMTIEEALAIEETLNPVDHSPRVVDA